MSGDAPGSASLPPDWRRHARHRLRAAARPADPVQRDGWWASADARDAARVIRAAASLSLGLAYMAAFALLFLHGLPRKLLMVFVPAGRMALSNYLAQSLIGVALYYGAGAGFGPARELSPVLLLGLALFATQSAGSAWWLRRFHYGPCEWLWRSATCGSWQALRRRATAVNAPQRRMENPS